MPGSWEERAAAGGALAAGAGGAHADRQILELLLDPDDTAVTFRTAVALVEQRTTKAIRLIMMASATADDNHLDWLGEAVDEFRARGNDADESFLREALRTLERDDDPACARAARLWLSELGWA